MTRGTNWTAYKHAFTKQGTKSGGAGIRHHAYTCFSSETTVQIQIKYVIGTLLAYSVLIYIGPVSQTIYITLSSARQIRDSHGI